MCQLPSFNDPASSFNTPDTAITRSAAWQAWPSIDPRPSERLKPIGVEVPMIKVIVLEGRTPSLERGFS